MREQQTADSHESRTVRALPRAGPWLAYAEMGTHAPHPAHPPVHALPNVSLYELSARCPDGRTDPRAESAPEQLPSFRVEASAHTRTRTRLPAYSPAPASAHFVQNAPGASPAP